MKKILLSIISIFLLQSITFSQVVLNFNTHAPLAGDNVNFIEIPFFEPGPGGKDMVWDFTKVTPLTKTVISEHIRPDKNIIDKFSQIPNMQLNEDEKSHFFNLTPSTYEVIGVVTDKYELVYNEPLKRLTYPFSYQDYFSGDFSGVAKYNTNYHIEITGKYAVEADAYGLLLLPGNCIKNVVRVKQHTKSVQVSMCSVVEVDTYKYVWYSFDERYPLVSVIVTEQKFSNGEFKLIQESYINEKVLECKDYETLTNIEDNNSPLFNYSVFPNPFRNNVSITYQINKSFNVTVGIYDIVGKRVKDIVLNENQSEGIYTYTVASTDIGLNPGIYFIKFEFDNKVLVEKIIRSH